MYRRGEAVGRLKGGLVQMRPGGMAGAANFSTGAGRSCGREHSVEVCITGRMSAPHGENK